MSASGHKPGFIKSFVCALLVLSLISPAPLTYQSFNSRVHHTSNLSPRLASASFDTSVLDMGTILDDIFEELKAVERTRQPGDAPSIVYLDLDDTVLRSKAYAGSEHFCGRTFSALQHHNLPYSEWYHSHARMASNGLYAKAGGESGLGFTNTASPEAIALLQKRCREEGINVKFFGLTARASMEQPLIKKTLSRFGVKLNEIIFVNNPTKTPRIQQHLDSFRPHTVPAAFIVDDSKRGLNKINQYNQAYGFNNLRTKTVKTHWYGLYHEIDDLKYIEQTFDQTLSVPKSRQSQVMSDYMRVALLKLAEFTKDAQLIGDIQNIQDNAKICALIKNAVATGTIDNKSLLQMFEQFYSILYFIIVQDIGESEFESNLALLFPIIEKVFSNPRISKTHKQELHDELIIFSMYRYVAIEDHDKKHLVSQKVQLLFNKLYELNRKRFAPYTAIEFHSSIKKNDFIGIRQQAAQGRKVLLTPPKHSKQGVYRHELAYAHLLGYDIGTEYEFWDGITPPTYSFSTSQAEENNMLDEIRDMRVHLPWARVLSVGYTIDELKEVYEVSKLNEKLSQRDDLLRRISDQHWARNIINGYTMEEIIATSSYDESSPETQESKLRIKRALLRAALGQDRVFPGLTYSMEEIIEADKADAKIAMLNEYRSKIIKNTVFLPEQAQSTLYAKLYSSLFMAGRATKIVNMEKTLLAVENATSKFRESRNIDIRRRAAPHQILPQDRIDLIFPEGFFDRTEKDRENPVIRRFEEYADTLVQATEIQLVEQIKGKPLKTAYPDYSTTSGNALVIRMPGIKITYHPTRKDMAPHIDMERDFWERYIAHEMDNNEIFIIESILYRMILASYLYEKLPDMLSLENVEAYTETIMARMYKNHFDTVISDYHHTKNPPAGQKNADAKYPDYKKLLDLSNRLVRQMEDTSPTTYINRSIEELDIDLDRLLRNVLEAPTTTDTFYLKKDIPISLAQKIRYLGNRVKEKQDTPSYRALRYHLRIFVYQLDKSIENLKDIRTFNSYLNEAFRGRVSTTDIHREEVNDITKQYTMELTVESGAGITTEDIIKKVNLIYRDPKLEFKYARSTRINGRWSHEFERAGTHGHLCNKLIIITDDNADAVISHQIRQASFDLNMFMPKQRQMMIAGRRKQLLEKENPEESDAVEFLAFTYLQHLIKSIEDNDEMDQVEIMLNIREQLDSEMEKLFSDGKDTALLHKTIIRLKNLGINTKVKYDKKRKNDIQIIRQRLHDDLLDRDSFISQSLELAFSKFNMADVHSHISGSIEPELLLAMFWADQGSRRDFVETMVINNEDTFRGRKEKIRFDNAFIERMIKPDDPDYESTIVLRNPQNDAKDIRIDVKIFKKLIYELADRNNPDFPYQHPDMFVAAGDIIFYLASSGTNLVQDSQIGEIADHILRLRKTFDWEKGDTLRGRSKRDKILTLADLSRRPPPLTEKIFTANCANFSSYVRFRQKDNKGDILAYLYILETGSIPLRSMLQPEFIRTAMADKILRDYENGVRSLEIRSSGARVGAKYSMEDTIVALMEGHELGHELIARHYPYADPMDTAQIICFRKEVKSIMGAEAYVKYKAIEKQTLTPGEKDSYKAWGSFFTDIADYTHKPTDAAPQSRDTLKNILQSHDKFRGLVFTLKNDSVLTRLAQVLSLRPSKNWSLEKEIHATIAVLNKIATDPNPQRIATHIERHLKDPDATVDDFNYYLKSLKELIKGAEAEDAVNSQMDTLIRFQKNLHESILLLDLLLRTAQGTKLNTKHISLLNRIGIIIDTALTPKQLHRDVLSYIEYNTDKENLKDILHILQMADIRINTNNAAEEYLKKALNKLKAWDERLIAVDTVGAEYQSEETESPYHTWIHRQALTRAREHGFMVTEHAGESWRPSTGDTVQNALNRIKVAISRGAQRIGHATIARIDPRKLFDSIVSGSSLESNVLINHMISKGIIVESCPTSNFLLQDRLRRFFDHPLAKILAVMLKVVPATDNSGILNTSQPREFALTAFVNNLPTKDIKQLFTNMHESTFKYLKEQEKQHTTQLITPNRQQIIYVTGEPMAGKTTAAMSLSQWYRNPYVISSSEILKVLAYIWILSGRNMLSTPEKTIPETLAELEIEYKNGEAYYYHPLIGEQRALTRADFMASGDRPDITATSEFRRLASRPNSILTAEQKSAPVLIAEWIAGYVDRVLLANKESMDVPITVIVEGGRRTTREIQQQIKNTKDTRSATFYLSNGKIKNTTSDLIALRIKWENPSIAINDIRHQVKARFESMQTQQEISMANVIPIETSNTSVDEIVMTILATLHPVFRLSIVDDLISQAA